MTADVPQERRLRVWQTEPELPPELFEVWRKANQALSPVAVVATVDADGAPRTAPFGSVRAVTPRLLRLSTHHVHKTYANLCRDGRVSLALVSPGQSASVRGRAGVVRERMEHDPDLAVVDIDVEQVKNDMVVRIVVENGIAVSPKERFKPWYDAAMAELEGMGGA